VKLTTHFHLVPRSRICGTIPPLPQYAFIAWCLVKAQGLYLYLSCANDKKQNVAVVQIQRMNTRKEIDETSLLDTKWKKQEEGTKNMAVPKGVCPKGDERKEFYRMELE
jgi:hypothetical protein